MFLRKLLVRPLTENSGKNRKFKSKFYFEYNIFKIYEKLPGIMNVFSKNKIKMCYGQTIFCSLNFFRII